MKKGVPLLLACLALVACDKKLSGVYTPQGGNSIIEKLDFVSSDAVNISMMGQTMQATYKINGDQVLIGINGQQQVFKLNAAGCLEGGEMFGKLCKAG